MALNILGNAYVAVHAITTGFKSDVNDAVNDISKNSKGSMFSGMFSGVNKDLSKFQQEALAANAQFTRMVQVGYALGPAISFLVGGISSLVSGLVSLVAQVGVAVPSLIVLPGILMAIGQAAIVGVTAFKGIGAALQQLKRGGRGGGGGGGAQREAAEANLARVLESNRESLARASENLADAEERLTEARKEAAESLQQLNFDAEDAAISEKKASIQLEQARERLARVQDLPPNSRARREAELAYAEADLNLRRAKDRNTDLAKETEEANKKGVEGSQRVVDATEAIQDAVDAKAKAERDALRQQLDAEKALKRAGAGGGGGGGDDAMSKLSKEAQDFVKYLNTLKDTFKGLKAAAGKDLFPQLTVAIQKLVDKLLPALLPMFQKTGKALGGVAVTIASVVTEASNLRELARIGDTNTHVIGALGKVFANLYDILLSTFDAAGPLIRRFADWAVALTDGWKATRETRNQTGQLEGTFKRAGDAAAQIGSVLGNIGGALMNIGRAATGPGSGGQNLMDAFEGATKKFEEFTQRLLDDGSLRQFFVDTAENTKKIMSFITGIVDAFIRLGDNPAIGKTADSLKNVATPAVAGILDTLINAGPFLAEFVGKLAELMSKFTESRSIEIFFKVLGAGVDVLSSIFGNPIVQKILMVIAPIMGAVKAFSLMASVGGFAFKVIIGYGIKLAKLTRIIKLVGLAIKAAFIANPVGMIILAIIAVIAIVVIMYKKFKWFRDFVHAVWDGIKMVVMAVFNWIKDNWPLLLAILTGPIGLAVLAIVKNWDKIKAGFKAAWDGIKLVFDTVWNAIKLAIATGVGIINTIWNGIKSGFERVWNGVKTIFYGVWDPLVAAVEALEGVFSGVWDGVKAGFKLVFNWIADKWNNSVGKLSFKIPFTDIGFDVPDIPKLATGGVVPAVSGGNLYRLGEGGRRERVEPLDPDGLSKRDKAMIKMLSGGGGVNINVYAAPGMDEAALAKMVSRQLAFQLRKGAA